MWNEIVIFLPAGSGLRQLEQAINSHAWTAVSQGGKHLQMSEGPIEVYTNSDLWSSYSEDERKTVNELIENAHPVAIFYFNRQAVRNFLHMLPENIEAYVDKEDPGILKLVPLAQFIASEE
ncbi:hypothetical protein [Amycolatopsis sp. H20-H5]|uniref:hypothetical protein n=1 Tax=Amycolatopsis sp. H20-H5 TaxID=3046309 RepID=UPI002DB8CEB9|nr:hypothetical protein [Amycolatopsis sp. H20-H5]MEC3980199.1 hypothetical protein [Amycolatopsis sp. H20-H5]